MPFRDLPARPDLAQLKRQARELHRAHRAGSRAASARFGAHHPRLKARAGEPAIDTTVSLADAQLVLAREYGFASWARLKHHVETAQRLARIRPHPAFDAAVHALDHGDIGTLRDLLARHPELVHARTRLEPPYDYFSGATLLHHVAGNPDRGRLDGRLPPLTPSIVDGARVLLEAGADVNAETLGPNGGTTMGLLVTSKQASDAGVAGPLIEVLFQHGARLDLNAPDALDAPLANHAPRAAEKMIELGAKPDLFAAAALGRMDLLRGCFDAHGQLLSRPRRRGRVVGERDAIGLALLYAYVRGQHDAAELLLQLDGNWDATGVNNGTVLHRAAAAGDLPMVQRLVAKGADTANRDNPFCATPLAWAAHAEQRDVFDWLRTNTTVDLHDAVCFDLEEQVTARLRERPERVDAQLDQWDLPQGTPLHWAIRSRRASLAHRLLAHGADPDIVAGNGLTALDMALAAGVAGLSAILERHGARRAAEL